MGWSYAKKAGETMDKWISACLANSGVQNTFKINKTYFWEASRTEHLDGAITGSIWEIRAENRCHRVGSFRINGDGTIQKAPAFLKKA